MTEDKSFKDAYELCRELLRGGMIKAVQSIPGFETCEVIWVEDDICEKKEY